MELHYTLGERSFQKWAAIVLIMTSKRDQILIATRDLVFEQGLQDTSMSQIAQRADVGMGTIYNYFASKEDLVFNLYSGIKAAMSDYALEGYDAKQPVVMRFLHILTRFAHYGMHYPREFRLSQQLGHVPYILAQANEYPVTLTVQDMFAEARSQHLLKDLPDAVMILLMFGGLNALVEAHATQQLRLDDTLIGQAVWACWDAIRR